jgi:hypothetical protein
MCAASASVATGSPRARTRVAPYGAEAKRAGWPAPALEAQTKRVAPAAVDQLPPGHGAGFVIGLQHRAPEERLALGLSDQPLDDREFDHNMSSKDRYHAAITRFT